MAPDPAAMKRRRWWIAGATIGGMLLLFVTVFLLWLFSTADLDAVDARARSLGLPANFDEAKLPLSPPEDLAKWDAVVAALAKCPRWKAADGSTWKGPRNGEPIPDGVREHLAAQKAELAVLFSAVDALPEAGVWLRDRGGLKTNLDEITPVMEVIRVLGDAMLLPGIEVEAGERLLRTARVAPSGDPSLIGFLVRISMIEMTVPPLLSIGWDGRGRERLIREGEKMTAYLQVRQWCRSEYLCQRAYINEIGLNGESISHAAAQFGSSARYPGDWLIATVDLRMHRSRLLEKLQNLSKEIPSGSPLDIYNREIESEESLGLLRYSRLREFWPAISMVIAYQLQLHLKLAVLYAELSGEPWPVDPFDAKGGPVRQLIKDGQLIGVYSIGKDQIDDHGDKQKDIVLKLRPRPAPVDAKPPGGR